jgi:hypothetical protein
MSFFSYAFNKNRKQIFYTIIYAVTAVLKAYFIYTVSYTMYSSLLPDMLASPAAGIAISILLSTVSFMYGFTIYRKDLDSMPIGSFMLALLIDTLLSQMIFVPFIM